jgi:hypothetical protein
MDGKQNSRVVLCSKCGKTTTEDDAFLMHSVASTGDVVAVGAWICKECLIIQEAVAGLDESKRTFETGATRDANATKLAYDQGLSVQVLQAYLEYLGKHRTMKDGSLRNWNNWKKGIPPDTYRESLLRHTVDAVRKSYNLPVREESSLNDLLCAIIFNASGWLFERLVENTQNREGA